MTATKLRRGIAALSLAAGAIVVAAPATPAYAATCHWKVIWNTAGVYEAGNTNSRVLKTKHLGDIVGPYCDQVIDGAGTGEYMVVVHCDCATNHGKYAFMRRNALRYIGA